MCALLQNLALWLPQILAAVSQLSFVAHREVAFLQRLVFGPGCRGSQCSGGVGKGGGRERRTGKRGAQIHRLMHVAEHMGQGGIEILQDLCENLHFHATRVGCIPADRADLCLI